jgi:hypothetical protein
MADLFLSYSRADRAKAAAVAGALEAGGRSLWWDRQLASGEDYARVIEREIATARCVVVGWSGTARESLWVRAEANEALDQGKLVQVNFDGAKLPLPFTMLHFVDLTGWGGGREQAPWPEVEARVSAELGEGDTDEAASRRRPNPGGFAPIERREPALQGLGKVAALGWAALALAVVLALSVLLVARGLISAGAFGAVSIAAALLAALLLLGSAFLLLRISAASRR